MFGIWFNRLLEKSNIYNLVQIIFAPGSSYFLDKLFKSVFNDSGGLVLDVGSGPLLTTPFPNGQIVGLDINLHYLQTYPGDKKNNAVKTRGVFNYSKVVGSADFLPFKSRAFDECRSFGLLHHLPDESAVATIRGMLRCARNGGKVIIIDNVWPRNIFLRPMAWLVRKMDRGRWVRHEEALIQLVNRAHAGDWRFRRFTYSFNGLESLVLMITK